MDRFEDDILFDELRVVRPTPQPEFTAELDERAAAGFPRRDAPKGQAPFARLIGRWRATPPRRRLIPVLGIALTVLVVATAIVATSGSDPQNPEISAVAGGGPVPARASANTKLVPNAYEAPLPELEADAASTKTRSNSVKAENYVRAQQNLPGVKAEPFSATVAPLPPGHRDIERSASVVLGTKPGEVSAAAAKVYTAVHAADGIVLHSSVQSGSKGATGASFALLIPSRKLDDALAAFSSIAEVRERHDATADITEPTVSAAEELTDSNAAIEGLLKELAGVETEAERESVEARLREERHHHASIRASLDHLNERAAMSEVTVRIVTGSGAGVTPAGKGSDGGWSVGDALHDAGQILTIAAGIILVALAVLAPIALIALALWLTNRFRLRRQRERALG
jgi:hypothetical protein